VSWACLAEVTFGSCGIVTDEPTVRNKFNPANLNSGVIHVQPLKRTEMQVSS